MKTIQLLPYELGKYALVDDDLYEALVELKWRYAACGYAVIRLPKNSKNYGLLMHRLVNRTPPGFHTDHRNGNKLDNRRSNLRTCTASQNLMNRSPPSNNTTGFKGVVKVIRHHKTLFMAQINAGRAHHFLGYFPTAQEAHATYVAAAQQMHGEFHRPPATPAEA